MIEDTQNMQADAITRLSGMLFVFHAWQNLPILGTDGAMFNLDTKSLDVDGDNPVSIPNGDGPPKVRSGGVGYLKRLRLIPITATQKAIINNGEGFSVSNMFVGNIGADGQPAGIGSSLSGSTKTNVKAEWSYPEHKAADMEYTFGKYGLIRIKSCAAENPESYMRCQRIFKVIMAGITDRTLLEDLPEYFGETSEYLLDKSPAYFPHGTALQIVEKSAGGGMEIPLQDGIKKKLVLDEADYAIAERLLAELPRSIMQAHTAALDPEANGILAQTREGLQTRQKRSYDKSDQWLMGQFPSFPMDTEVEKSNKQMVRALDAQTRPVPALQAELPEGLVTLDDLNVAVSTALQEQRKEFEVMLSNALAVRPVTPETPPADAEGEQADETGAVNKGKSQKAMAEANS